MTLNLIVASGAHEGEVIPIRRFPFVVGRTKECHLHAASEFVSRRHCEISLHDDKPCVVDLDSTNGTFVNGQAVSHDQELSPVIASWLALWNSSCNWRATLAR